MPTLTEKLTYWGQLRADLDVLEAQSRTEVLALGTSQTGGAVAASLPQWRAFDHEVYLHARLWRNAARP